MLRAKTVTFLRTESGLSALSSSWTYVAGQKGDISRQCPVYVCPTSVHLEHVGRTVVFLTFLRTESGLSALSSSWTYVAGQKGDISRHRARSTFVLR